ncbi:hypothetical protein [Candidatus Tisiphia endosymbiont of Micropterix aruncella]
MYILNPNLELLANKMLEQTTKVEVKEAEEKMSLKFIKPIRKTTSFVKNW